MRSSAAGDALARVVDGQLGRPRRGHRLGVDAVVELSVEDHVAQRVDVAVGVAVDVHRQAVGGEGEARSGGVIGPVGHLVDGRIGVVGRHLARYRRGQ
jgi:hypothetical protein